MSSPATTRPGVTGTGYIDAAYVLPARHGPGAFLLLQGWFSAEAPPHRPLTAEVNLLGRLYRFPCDAPRPDVARADPKLSGRGGFDVVLTLPAMPEAADLLITFFAAGTPIGGLTRPIAAPIREVAARAGALTQLRAAKLHNLILNERERLSHAIETTALPVTGQIDPAFGCNLHCPLCQSQMIRAQGYRMANLKLDRLGGILDRYGPTLVRIWLSLWGEPLLNPQLAAAVQRCKAYDIWVMISSNMSVPLSAARVTALVESGIDTIMLSIDGATQPTYARYRVGGDLGLALDNARRLLVERARQGRSTPYLYWRYLEFPWNGHEIAAARRLAAEIGVDEFRVETGVLTPETAYSLGPRGRVAARTVAPALEQNWRGLAAQRAARNQYFGCDYLYSAISINANGLVHPCCYVVAPGDAVGRAEQPAAALRNGGVLRTARAAFAAVAEQRAGPLRAAAPCAACPVVAACDGHVITQTHFVQLYEHLLLGTAIRW